MSMSVLVTIFVSLVIGMVLGIALEGWWPQIQRRVELLNDYWLSAVICDCMNSTRVFILKTLSPPVSSLRRSPSLRSLASLRGRSGEI